MNKRKRVIHKSRPNSNIQAMLILGTGLILLGLAAFVAWPRGTASSAGSASSDSLTMPVAVNYAAPDLVLSDLNGVEHALTDYRGQVVLVNLWATWCPPCKAEMPTLEAYYQAHQTDGFVTFAVDDGDPADAVKTFVDQYNLSFPVLLDPTYQASDHAFKTRNLPSSFVIDREGNIRLRWVGGIDRATLEKYVTPLLAE